MRKINRKELTTLTLIASTVSLIAYNSTMQDYTKRRTLNEEITIIKNFFNQKTEVTKNKKTKEEDINTKKITIKDLKEIAFKRIL